MNILLSANNYFLPLVHYLSLFDNSICILLDGHEKFCIWVVTTPHILDGLQWLHAFALSSYYINSDVHCNFLSDGHDYFLSFLIPVDKYVCVQLLPSQFLILSIYVRIYHFFAKFDLVYTSDFFYDQGIYESYSEPRI